MGPEDAAGRRMRPRGTYAALKAAVGTTPRRVTSRDVQGSVHVPHWRDFRPLLRPDGPFYGSGA